MQECRGPTISVLLFLTSSIVVDAGGMAARAVVCRTLLARLTVLRLSGTGDRMHGSTWPQPATGYEGRIGRYGPELAIALMKAAGVRAGQRALEVGCGSGALTEPLCVLLGPQNLAAVDPDAVSVDACRARLPGLDVRVAAAEDCRLATTSSTSCWPNGRQFHERPTSRRGRDAASPSVWRRRGGLRVGLRRRDDAAANVWDAAGALDPAAASRDQAATRAFADPDKLDRLWRSAGLADVATAGCAQVPASSTSKTCGFP